jgi:outer membrane protein OmpU
MKKILLTTTALTMSAGVAAADLSLSGRAGAGVISGANPGAAGMDAGVESEVWSGIDIAISASVETDGGLSLSVSDDIGGGKLPDYADKELDDQTGDIGTPAVAMSYRGATLTIDNQDIDDLYDDDQSGDIGLSANIGGVSVGLTMDTDAADNAPTSSYSVGYTVSGIALSLAGTDADEDGNSAMVWSASYGMGDLTIGIEVDNNGEGDDVTTGSVTYAAGGGLSVTLSADDNDDWDASASWSSGGMSVSYSTDEESEWEADVSMDLGSGVSLNASADHNETTIVGVNFTF